MKYLIVNADDFGLSKSVNEGIIHAHKQGIVSSTTVMMNMPYAQEAIHYHRDNPKLGFGVHLVLTQGRPLGKGYQTLLNKDGFFSQLNVRKRQFDKEEVIHEWSLQIEAFQNMGIEPSHLDSHQGIYRFQDMQSVCLALQKKYRLPFRNHFHYWHPSLGIKTDFSNRFFKEGATASSLKSIISKVKNGHVLEVMCHPGYLDRALVEGSNYSQEREKELAILCSDEIKDYILKENIKLINYSKLPEKAGYTHSWPKLLKYLYYAIRK